MTDLISDHWQYKCFSWLKVFILIFNLFVMLDVKYSIICPWYINLTPVSEPGLLPWKPKQGMNEINKKKKGARIPNLSSSQVEGMWWLMNVIPSRNTGTIDLDQILTILLSMYKNMQKS